MHDVIVIGGGPGGYATAFRAHARGLDVALVEDDKVGGACLHRGCIPSKASLHVAEILEQAHRADVLGLRLNVEGVDGEGLEAFRSGVISGLYKGLSGLVDKRTAFLPGRGRIIEPGRVEVTAPDGPTTTLEGRHVVIATGSAPRHLPGIEVDGRLVQDSDTAVHFTTVPSRAVIIGAGAVGMEFASMWRPMGSEVTVVEMLDRVLPLEDEDVSRMVERAFRKQGITVMTGASVDAVATSDDAGMVVVQAGGEQHVLNADLVLVAVGRAPVTSGCGAAELGVLDERGYVDTDELGRTKLEGVWAVGDVRPTLALAHAAFAEGFVVADAIAGVDPVRPVDHEQTPRVTFCHPEAASVGLTEAQARERHGDGVAATTYSLRANAKGLISGLDGFVKVIVGGPDGEVLGVHVVGPHATDLIGEAALATAWGALPEEVAAIIHPHPTLIESLGETFMAAAGVPFHTH